MTDHRSEERNTRKKGSGALQYGLTILLIILAAYVGLPSIGNKLSQTFTSVSTKL